MSNVQLIVLSFMINQARILFLFFSRRKKNQAVCFPTNI